MFTTDDMLRIPDVTANGNRKSVTLRNGKPGFTYQLEKDGVRYTILTEKKGGKETFWDFYTNRKSTASNGVDAKGDTDLTAHSNDVSASSSAKLQKVSGKDKDETEKIFNAAKNASARRKTCERLL